MLEPDSSDIMGKGWHLFLVLTLSNKKLQYASQDLENKSIHSRRKLISGSIWEEPFLLFAICKVSCNIFLLHKKHYTFNHYFERDNFFSTAYR